MNRHPWLSPALAMLALAPAVALAQDAGWAARGAASGPCQSFFQLSGTVTAAAGLTAGIIGPVQVGETYQLTVSGPGSGTFRIVGEPTGAVTYAGPANVPASLGYTVVNATPPAGAIGVGYLFNAGAGTVTISASCTRGGIPSLDAWSRTLLGLLLALCGVLAIAFMRRRAGAA